MAQHIWGEVPSVLEAPGPVQYTLPTAGKITRGLTGGNTVPVAMSFAEESFATTEVLDRSTKTEFTRDLHGFHEHHEGESALANVHQDQGRAVTPLTFPARRGETAGW